MKKGKSKKASTKMSLSAEIWYRLKKDRMAMIGLVIICIMCVLAIFAPIIAPYGFDEQNANEALQFPSWKHLCGTDNFGRDIMSRIIYGSRVSLQVGLISVSIGLIAGCILGAISAYYTKFDNLIMRFMDILAGIPNLLLSICIAAVLGTGLTNLMIAIGVSAIPTYARLMRASVLSEKGKEYVEAAVSIGASQTRVIVRHIIPNAFSPIVVQATLGVASAILLAAALSYLGLGIQPPNPEWGAMLSAGRIYIRDYWYMTVAPGVAIMVTVYALNMLGDGLRDALDPRLKN